MKRCCRRLGTGYTAAAAALIALLLSLIVASPALASPFEIIPLSVSAGNITDTTATITWDTDEEGNSTVNYGNSSTSLDFSTSDGTMALNHVINLTGLEPATTYYYEVISTNALGNTTVDNNSGSYYTFNTKNPAPVISGVSAGSITDTAAVISWATDQPGNSTVNYGNSIALGSSISDTDFLIDHEISLTSLTADTLYYYAVISANTDGMSTVDDNGGNYYTFTTAQHLHFEGWAWFTNYDSVADATLDGYILAVERGNATGSFSLHAVGNLTLERPSGANETIELDMYGSRVRSLFYLRQEVTGKSATFTGTWIAGNESAEYAGTMEGVVALPNPEGTVLKTARVGFALLRTAGVPVPIGEPDNFVLDIEYILAVFTAFINGLIDKLMLTDFANILGSFLAKIAELVAYLRSLGTPYVP